jgi:hypothetical protein
MYGWMSEGEELQPKLDCTTPTMHEITDWKHIREVRNI